MGRIPLATPRSAGYNFVHLLPRPMPASFTAHLTQLNQLDEQGFQHWFWRPGMLFAAERTWWGREAARIRIHEGLDICLFVDGSGVCRSLAAGTMIPVILAGKVLAVFADFLGHSIVVAHSLKQGGRRLCSVYAHVLPEAGIKPGHRCQEGEVIARIAPNLKPAPPVHLHLTTFWLAGRAPQATRWSWSLIGDLASIRLCDPLEFIGRPPGNPSADPGTEGAWQVYIVSCRDGSLYTGITTDLDRRLAEHNTGDNGADQAVDRKSKKGADYVSVQQHHICFVIGQLMCN